MPEISIITPTYNRVGQLPKLLGALESQTFKDFELILVNDGSCDGTKQFLQSIDNDRFHYQIKILDIENSGRSLARNIGVKNCVGDLLIFFDDDTRPNANSVFYHHQYHTNVKGQILGGPYVYDSSLLTSDFHLFRRLMEEKWYPIKDHIHLIHSLRINGGNFSIKKDLFELVGGFDDRLTDKEDFFLAFQLREKVLASVYFDYRTWVFHDDFKSLKEYVSRIKDTRKQEMKLKDLSPKIEQMFPERFILKERNFFKDIIVGLCAKKGVLAIASSTLFSKLLPKGLKFFIYDLIITSSRIKV